MYEGFVLGRLEFGSSCILGKHERCAFPHASVPVFHSAWLSPSSLVATRFSSRRPKSSRLTIVRWCLTVLELPTVDHLINTVEALVPKRPSGRLQGHMCDVHNHFIQISDNISLLR
jgi:hypothetical protein